MVGIIKTSNSWFLLLTITSDAAEQLSNLGGVEIAFEYADDDEEDDNEEGEDGDAAGEGEEAREGLEGDSAIPRRPVYITREQIMQLLGNAGLGRIFASDYTPRSIRRRVVDDEDDEEEEEDQDDDDDELATEYDMGRLRRTAARARGPRGKAAFDKVPSDRGKELMNAGTFGSNVRKEDSINRKKRLAYDVMRRELGLGSNGRQKNTNRLIKQDMIPESVADTIIHYNARCYSGQFSDDGNFFFSCAQDFRVRMYDTSNPYDWKYYKVSGNLLCSSSEFLTLCSLLCTLTGNGRLQMHLSVQIIVF